MSGFSDLAKSQPRNITINELQPGDLVEHRGELYVCILCSKPYYKVTRQKRKVKYRDLKGFAIINL